MSISGSISNYYVDSLISHESEETSSTKFTPGQYIVSRQTGLTEHPDFSACNFQPKSPAFSTSWSPLYPQTTGNASAVYHPFVQTNPVSSEGRYMRSWLEPTPRTVAVPGIAPNRQDSLKTESLVGAGGETLLVPLQKITCESSENEAIDPSKAPYYEDNTICEATEDKETRHQSKLQTSRTIYSPSERA
uniref:Homeobox protein HoxB9 n=1 Tax=Callorhinchus milii TaxID=7868 RepID=V9L4S3_CALMI